MSWANVVGKFGVFYHKKEVQNSISIQVPQKSTIYRRCQLLRNLCKICTDDYDNYEYLAMKYIRFFTNDII